MHSDLESKKSCSELSGENSFNEDDIFEWNNIRLSLPAIKDTKEKRILDGISGIVRAGQVIGIMGGSGAGKTSLLNVLSGRISKGRIEGTVMLNGRRRPENWVELVGYVEQEDILLGSSTVRESIEFSAKLRLPKGTSKKDIDTRVEKTITSLGLEECANNLIGGTFSRGISGGQRKRVSIGLEVVADSKLLFLDEPTTGLDAFNAQSLIETVKTLAVEQKKIVILTIHQPRPDVLRLFDKIFLLSRGKSAFFGSLDDALSYFESLGFPCPSLVNPADFFIDIITPDHRTEVKLQESQKRVDFLTSKWLIMNPPKDIPYSKEDSQGYKIIPFIKVGYFTQLAFLVKREVRSLIREKFILMAMFIQTIFLTLLICVVYYKIDFLDANSTMRRLGGALYIIAANTQFSTIMPITTIFPQRKNLFIREKYANYYKSFLAYIAIALTILPSRIFCGLVMSSISYLAINLRPGFYYFCFSTLFIITLILVCMGIGLTMGSISTNITITQILCPMLLLIFMFFSGGLSDNNAIPGAFRWIQYISIMQWMFRGLLIIQLKDYSPNANFVGNNVLQTFAYSLDKPWFSLLMLLAIGTFFYSVGLFCIGRTYRRKTIII